MIVKRKRLNFWERLYLPAIFGGFKVTLRHFFQQESDDAVSRAEMGRAARVIAARLIW